MSLSFFSEFSECNAFHGLHGFKIFLDFQLRRMRSRINGFHNFVGSSEVTLFFDFIAFTDFTCLIGFMGLFFQMKNSALYAA